MKKTVCVLLLFAMLVSVSCFPVSASQVETTPRSPEETTPQETALEETIPEETIPEETVPEETFPATYTVDTTTEIYQVCKEAARQLEARQILVYDTATDTLLFSKAVEGEKLYPASITKLFSAYVALQYLAPEDVITAGPELEMVREGSSLAYIAQGQQLYTKTVIQGMLLPSGNDAAMVLAAAAGRKIDPTVSSAEEAVRAFVAEMNRQAQELGFEKSHFVNPDGFHVGSHYTCINDMVRVAQLALANDTIRRYMGVAEANVQYLTGQYNEWKNTNLMLDPEETKYYRSDTLGMKTGHTSQGGYSFLSAFRNGDGTLVIGMFGCPDLNARFRDTIRMLIACKAQFRLEEQRALEAQKALEAQASG